MRPFVLVSLLLLSAARDAPADEGKNQAPTAASVADRVVAAVDGKDEPGLRAIAAARPFEAWLVADELLGRGRNDAAAAFAAHVRGKDDEHLAAYVRGRSGHASDPKARAAVAAAARAFAAGEGQAALEALKGHPASAEDVVSVRVLQGRGMVLKAFRRLEEASVALEAAGVLAAKIGWRARASSTFQHAAHSAFLRGDWTRAKRLWIQRLQVEEARESARAIAATLANLGLAQTALGNYGRAVSLLRRAARIFGDADMQRHVGWCFTNLGIACGRLADYPRALAYYERARQLAIELKDPQGLAGARGNMANIYLFMGDPDRAIELLKQAHAYYVSKGDDRAAARTLGNLGSAESQRGDLDRALELLEQNRVVSERLGDRDAVLTTLTQLGAAYVRMDEHAKALAHLDRALAMARESKDREGIAEALLQRVGCYVPLGRKAEARTDLDEAVRLAERLRSPDLLVNAMTLAAGLQLMEEDYPAALASARRGVPYLEDLVRGQSQAHGAGVRAVFAGLFRVGALAAAGRQDPEALAYFLELGRAGTLLEALGGRDALRATLLPDELIEAETLARRDAARAHAAYRDALGGRDLAASRKLRQEHEAAKAAVRSVIERIQRHEKGAGSVVYPTAATLDEIQGWLRPEEALVIYGLYERRGLALVVTPSGAKMARIDVGPGLEETCRELLVEDDEAVIDGAVERVRRAAVAPLGLGKDVKRVLVSPSGVLSYVPFALLLGDREVAYLPSATTYGILRDDLRRTGRGVLALGDPDYRPKKRAGGGGLSRGRVFAPLPATREEAKAVGDVLLLGAEATRPGLVKAIAARPRWRAVHFACHGVIDPQRPTMSALALTPDGEESGLVTALDVFRLEIPADLVVLSACETGKGRVVEGEGIVGLARAFMYAGSPRVLASLWKVDDEATRALMAKFYERWHAKDGAKGLAAAAALKEAQAFVRAQDKWRHPYYWAAWVLWGLPQ